MLTSPTKRSPANTMTSKLSLYFAFIAVVVGATLFVLSQSMLYWLEDELSRRTLQQSAGTAIVQFKHEAKSPLIITTNIRAYNRVQDLPKKYRALAQYPIGFLDEIQNSDFDDLFLYHSEYTQDGTRFPLLIIMNAEHVELSPTEWRYINLISIIVVLVLFLLFGYAIIKLTRRLITPITQLSQQLKSNDPNSHFSVPSDSAIEFNELAESLNRYRQQNEKLIQQEQAFARYASHELRTPLTVILGATWLLKQKAEPEYQTRQRERIAKAATDMQHTIEALLSLVKQEQAKENVQLRIINRSELEHIIEYVQPLAESKGLSITLQMHCEPKIQPSESVLRMLLTNLLNNAINACDAGVIAIEVDQNCIRITDQGTGLNESEQSPQGHGLGLLIVDALCQRYDWEFNLSQAPESGCIATLSFIS